MLRLCNIICNIIDSRIWLEVNGRRIDRLRLRLASNKPMLALTKTGLKNKTRKAKRRSAYQLDRIRTKLIYSDLKPFVQTHFWIGIYS